MLVNICDIQSVLKAKTKLVRGMEDQVSRLAAGESFLFSGHESTNSLYRSTSMSRINNSYKNYTAVDSPLLSYLP